MFVTKTFKLFILKLPMLFVTYVFADIAVLTPDNKSVELFIDYKIISTPPIPDNGMIGLLVRSNPPDACSKIDKPVDNKHNWFVLADRSSSYNFRCVNREKILHAAEAGYKAIILYSPYENYFQSAVTYYSLDTDSNTSIPAVLVSHEDGETLKNRYLNTTGYKIYITSDIPPNLSYYLLPFAIVIGVCLLLTISFMIFQLIRCVQERRKAQRHRLSKKYLKKLPLQKFVKGGYYETCAICLDDYVDGEKMRILPCNHAYHTKCIDPWLTKNRRVCPVCKAKVTLPGMPESDDSDSDNGNRRTRTSNEDSNERSQLLPSRSNNNNRSSRRNLGRLLLEARSDAIVSSSSHSSNAQPNYNSTSNIPANSQIYNLLLDDTLSIFAGPSTSAPVVTELSSPSTSQQQRGGGGIRSKRKHGHNRNVQTVAAEIATLIAPAQLSINGDTELESSNRSTSNAGRDDPTNSVDVAVHLSAPSSRPSKRSPVDHIV